MVDIAFFEHLLTWS